MAYNLGLNNLNILIITLLARTGSRSLRILFVVAVGESAPSGAL